jgi:pimeloyl-ACP methyl ester carboxylesterase
VYLHGAFAYGGWPPFLDALARRFTVYAPLHPGFADDPPSPPLGKGGIKGGVEQIDDLLDLTLYHFDLLDALGLKSPHLVGHFFGAMVAAEMAALRPNRVNRLVLAAPAGMWLDDNPGLDYFATPAGQLRKALFADPESAIARSALPEPQNDDERAQQNIERVRSLSVVGKFLWPIPDKGLKKRLHRIQAPTLVVVAENDQLVPPAYGHEFADRISGARLEVVKGAGHMFPLEKPDEFAALLTGFLRET